MRHVCVQIRELLDFYKFDGSSVPIVRGSALMALNGSPEELGKPSILKLLEQADQYITIPPRELDKPFIMPVEDVFSIAGRGTVATGRIETGGFVVVLVILPSWTAVTDSVCVACGPLLSPQVS